jgi:hypothetical protein
MHAGCLPPTSRLLARLQIHLFLPLKGQEGKPPEGGTLNQGLPCSTFFDEEPFFGLIVRKRAMNSLDQRLAQHVKLTKPQEILCCVHVQRFPKQMAISANSYKLSPNCVELFLNPEV